MKIIDAHMHYYNVDGFVQVAADAGYENTAACWQKICEENNIVFSVAMGNTNYTSSKYGGVTPRMIDLAAPFDEEHYNQPQNMGYCMGVNSEAITEANAEKRRRNLNALLRTRIVWELSSTQVITLSMSTIKGIGRCLSWHVPIMCLLQFTQAILPGPAVF